MHQPHLGSSSGDGLTLAGGTVHPLCDAFDPPATLDRSAVIVDDPRLGSALGVGGTLRSGPKATASEAMSTGATPGVDVRPVRAVLPPSSPTALGDPTFRTDWGLHAAYVGGAMANGIASVDLVAALARDGSITPEERDLARRLPMCDDLTAEADSGGHTDNRPLVTLLPSLIVLRDEIAREFGFAAPPRVGAAGGIGTPWAAHAAFSLGAAYILVGSIHQACVESGSSDTVRRLLAQAEPTDVAMAPAADMFEMGVELQVLRRGTMFPMRARQLYELYRRYGSWEEMPAAERTKVEKTQFRASFETIWTNTRKFFLARDPDQVERAESDPKHRTALVFRWYLGLSSAWANRGDPERTLDYQVWCGPSMGAFNEWVRGTALEDPSARRVVDVAHALLGGAARLARAELLRRHGVTLPPGVPDLRPRTPAPRADAMRTAR